MESNRPSLTILRRPAKVDVTEQYPRLAQPMLSIYGGRSLWLRGPQKFRNVPSHTTVFHVENAHSTTFAVVLSDCKDHLPVPPRLRVMQHGHP